MGPTISSRHQKLSQVVMCLQQGCPTRRPWYTFLAPYFTLPALTLIRIWRKKYFWINVCLNYFRSTPMNTVFPLLQSCFLLYPFYCPLTPLEKAQHLKSSLQTNNTSEPTLLWGRGHYYCRVVINLSSLNSPSRALSCLQIKLFSCELQNISGNTVIKFSSLPPYDFNFQGVGQAVSVQSRNSVFFSYQWCYLFFSLYTRYMY
jgi:hypothetical protein